MTALYQAYATGLVRLAMLMLADQQAAEDVVQDAFLGLYRRWGSLADPGKALTYVRSSVLNGCRTVLRKRSRHGSRPTVEPDAESAEALALLGEEHREVLAALRRLPARQREAVVLQALPRPARRTRPPQAMKISRGTVSPPRPAGIASLARMLKEES